MINILHFTLVMEHIMYHRLGHPSGFYIYSLIADCFEFASIMASLTLSEPPLIINTNDNVTLQCTASSLTKNSSLHWIVDDVPYNMTGIFITSRGELMIDLSPLRTTDCTIMSSLTVFNVQLNSQGVYHCVVQDNNFTLSMSRSILLNVESSNEGKHSYIQIKIIY